MVLARKREILLLHVRDIDCINGDNGLFPETNYTINYLDKPTLGEDLHVRQYVRYSGCNPCFLALQLGPYYNWKTQGCGGNGSGELEYEGSVRSRGYTTHLTGTTAGTMEHPELCTIHIDEYILEGGPELEYAGTCELFEWIGDVFLVIARILRDIGDRMGTVWFVGDVIQGWFNAAAGYFEAAKEWLYGLGDWCSQIMSKRHLGDAWTWLLGFFSDPGGYIMGFLGSVWTDLQDMYANFDTWVTYVLGGAWTWVLGLYSDFSGAVTSILGDTWTWLQGLYSDFSGAVISILGDTWTWLLTLYGDFTGAVIGALGGMWEWLTEFINDPMSKLSLDMLELVKSGFEWLTQEWFSFIDSTWDTFKGSFTWLIQKFFVLLDESWDTFEDSMKWLVGKTMDLVGDAAEDFKDKIWDVVEKVVKKL